MNYFRKIKEKTDVFPFLSEIDKNDDLWLHSTIRQEKNKVQAHTQSIVLRGAVPRADVKIWENQECVNSGFIERYPILTEFLNATSAELGGTLSRAKIVRLMPHHYVGVHTDKGSYYAIRNRYHLVLRSASGSLMQSGSELVTMREGELWWFDNKQHHSAYNPSDEWRVHVIFDILPTAFASLAINPVPLKEIVNSGIFDSLMPYVPIIRRLSDADSLGFPKRGESESLVQTGGFGCEQEFHCG